MAISITGPNDQLQTGNDALDDALESHFSFVNQELAALDGKAEVIRVLLPGVTYPSNLGNYGTYDAGSLRFGLVDQPEEIDLAAPRSGTYELVSRLERTASAPPKGAIDIHLQNGTEQQTAPLEYPHQYSAIVRLSAGSEPRLHVGDLLRKAAVGSESRDCERLWTIRRLSTRSAVTR